MTDPQPLAEAGSRAPFSLPSRLPAAELGLRWLGDGRASLPAGLVAPDLCEGERLGAATPEWAGPPDWWHTGTRALRGVHLAVSLHPVNLNQQAIDLMEAATAARASGLVVLAPTITDEALATLLANDQNPCFPRGITPLQLLVPEFHVDEVLMAIATAVAVRPWPGGTVPIGLVWVEAVHAAANETEAWLARRSGQGKQSAISRAARWWSRWRPRPPMARA